MRKLPVYLVLDTSGSMRGEPIEALNNGVQSLISSLRQDPYALETVHLSLISFDRIAQVQVPLTPLEQFILPTLVPPESGPTHLGAALELLITQIAQDVIPQSSAQKGDWRPLVFVLTDGSPSDTQAYEQACAKIQGLKWGGIVACAAGPKGKTEPLKKLTPDVYRLDTMNSHSFQGFFKWVSASVAADNQSVGLGGSQGLPLPQPPVEVQIVV
ncbi:MAG: VWA domain-containing protein [Candidatus Sericytochromatia bacterium]|nr:VWA domain-containing protein [Candidatus Sericytochromatia bacterium]